MKPHWPVSVADSSGSVTDGSVSSTSCSRAAEAAARGIITNMRTAIITDMRICMM